MSFFFHYGILVWNKCQTIYINLNANEFILHNTLHAKENWKNDWKNILKTMMSKLNTVKKTWICIHIFVYYWTVEKLKRCEVWKFRKNCSNGEIWPSAIPIWRQCYVRTRLTFIIWIDGQQFSNSKRFNAS